MTNVLILGANGQLARNTARVFLRDTDAKLTLYCAGPAGFETPIRRG
jgi:saccharopine dehydrogenase-like NADP-dependent oxidoreductase